MTLSRLLALVSVAPRRYHPGALKRVLSVESASLPFNQSQGGLCLSSAPIALGCAGRLQLGQPEHDLPRSQAKLWRSHAIVKDRQRRSEESQKLDICLFS